MTQARKVGIVLLCLIALLIGFVAYAVTNMEVRSTPTKCTIDEVRLGKC